MSILELVGQHHRMQKIKLTVFKENRHAVAFYLEKMKYVIDGSSPSNWGRRESYEILSKDLASEQDTELMQQSPVMIRGQARSRGTFQTGEESSSESMDQKSSPSTSAGTSPMGPASDGSSP